MAKRCEKTISYNLDRFNEETQLFDKINLTEEHINLISAIIDNVQLENSSLNQTSYYNILSRELERTSQIFEISVERQSTLNGTCTIASAFLTYLDPYTYRF
ncbi:unnamed protein product [Adineta steineri]|uniref:Uncharacterized protein n=1 Tax=Adineta steineri TaxID=433720 RepID=A0A815MEX2_9BILA|nr:unnamed protein product [Adineta steineri]